MTQERIEASARGRALISAGLLLFLATVFIANLPQSELRRTVMEVVEPVQRATGTGQRWDLFAPDPADFAVFTQVRFEYADGSRGTWAIGKRNPFIGTYRDYRWGRANQEIENDDLAQGLLLWAVDRHAGEKPLARAELVRRYFPIAKPGRPADSHPPPREQVVIAISAR